MACPPETKMGLSFDSPILLYTNYELLLRTATKGYIEGNQCLSTVVHVRSLIELGVKERLLSGEHFEVLGLTIVHQLVGTDIGLMEYLHLTVVIFMTLTSSPTVGNRLIHLVAGIDDSLHILLLQVLLRQLSRLVVGIDLTTGEDRRPTSCSNSLPGLT